MKAWGTGTTVDLTVTNTGHHTRQRLDARIPAGSRTDRRLRLEHGPDPGSNTIEAANAAHNATIAPGASITLGYLVEHTGDASSPPRFMLNGDACAVGD